MAKRSILHARGEGRARYAGGNSEFWTKGSRARFTWNGSALPECIEREADS